MSTTKIIRSYQEIWQDEGDFDVRFPNYSEILYYKIEKRSDPDSGAPIQTFWIPGSMPQGTGQWQSEMIKYIDTQVKINKNYFYSVFAYNAIVGSVHSYSYVYPEQAAAATPDPGFTGNCSPTFDDVSPSIVHDHDHDIIDWEVKGEIHATPTSGVTFSFYLGHTHLPMTPYEIHIPGAAAVTVDTGGIILDAPYINLYIEWLLYKAGAQAAPDVFQYGNIWTGKTAGMSPYTPYPGIPTPAADHYHLVSFEIGIGIDGAFYMHPETSTTCEPWEAPAVDYQLLNDQGEGQFITMTAPTAQIIQTHLFDFNGAILSDPSTAPDVFFIPYVGIDNKITLSMTAQLDEYRKEAVILNSSDADYIDLLRTTRGLGPTDPITYKTDDEVAGFEIYRTETKPSVYEDFSGKFIDSVSTLQRSTFEYIYSWDTTYTDAIVPNKTYYYMVRGVDIHGQKSYPSSIFQVQLINDAGAVYPLIEVVDLEAAPKPQTKTKNFKKFLHLVPAVAQKMINYEKSDLITNEKLLKESALPSKDHIVLGMTEDPSLFGNIDPADPKDPKRFKIRLISKNSGKKIDLNVAFLVKNE